MKSIPFEANRGTYQQYYFHQMDFQVQFRGSHSAPTSAPFARPLRLLVGVANDLQPPLGGLQDPPVVAQLLAAVAGDAQQPPRRVEDALRLRDLGLLPQLQTYLGPPKMSGFPFGVPFKPPKKIAPNNKQTSPPTTPQHNPPPPTQPRKNGTTPPPPLPCNPGKPKERTSET